MKISLETRKRNKTNNLVTSFNKKGKTISNQPKLSRTVTEILDSPSSISGWFRVSHKVDVGHAMNSEAFPRKQMSIQRICNFWSQIDCMLNLNYLFANAWTDHQLLLFLIFIFDGLSIHIKIQLIAPITLSNLAPLFFLNPSTILTNIGEPQKRQVAFSINT